MTDLSKRLKINTSGNFNCQKLRRAVPLIFAMIFLAQCTILRAQIQSLDPVGEVAVYFVISETGNLERFPHFWQGKHFLPELEYLQDREFCRTVLRLSPAQDQELTKWAKDFEVEMNDSIDFESFVQLPPESQSRQYREWYQKQKATVEAILTLEQVRLIDQFKLRRTLYLAGLDGCLLDKGFQSAIGINSRDSLELLPLVQKIEANWINEFNEGYKKFNTQIVQSLNKSQQEKFTQFFEEYMEHLSPNPELHVFQLGSEMRKLTPAAGKEDLQWLLTPTRFTLNVKGELCPVTFSSDPSRLFIKLFSDAKILLMLELSANQSQEIQDLLAQQDEYESQQLTLLLEKIAARESRSPELKSDVFHRHHKDLYDEKNRLVHEAVEKTVDRIRQVLVPQQLAALELVQAKYEARTYGLVSCLIDGKMGELLEISESQLHGLRKAAGTQRKQLVEKLRDHEVQIITTAAQLIAGRHGERFSSVMGPLPEYTQPNPSFLLTNPERR